MYTILVVDDEKPLRELIEMTLTNAGYSCTLAADGKAAADLIEERDYDLVLLDIMLPYIDGYELIEYIAPLGIPVIFLTAKSDVVDRVRGLRMGADDYIVKPFEPLELVARVESVLRRNGKTAGNITLWGVELDPAGRQVRRSGALIDLTPRELDLLTVLMQNPGKTLYRELLYEKVWGEPGSDTRTLDTHIQRLRRKLGWEERIKTLARVGYRLEKEE
ncbi:MAG: response regulator transcription factor [Oscillospiraceae bacterium]|nr:response regulator transcription factor [Oscillospiraceae bacterium]